MACRAGWLVGRPSAGPRVKCVDPGDDLRNRPIGKVSLVSPRARFREQSDFGRSGGETAPAAPLNYLGPQRPVGRRPLRGVKGIGPGEDLGDQSSTAL